MRQNNTPKGSRVKHNHIINLILSDDVKYIDLCSSINTFTDLFSKYFTYYIILYRTIEVREI